MKRRLRVLQVSSATVFGGNEEHIRTLVRYLDRERFEVAAAAPTGGEFATVLGRADVPLEPLTVNPKRPWRAAKRLARICRRRGIDIVHSHNRREDFVAALAGWATQVPVRISTIHDRINTSQQGERVRTLSCKLYNWTLRHGFDALITVSNATRQDVIAEAGVDPGRAVHVVNGMDLERLDKVGDGAAVRAELGIAPDELVCGMVARVRGREIEKKGHRYLFEAIPKVLEHAPNARFVIVGADDKAAAYLKELAASCGADARLHILGYRKDVLEVMQAFDVAVLPSLFEGLPRTLMEAMALGKPVVGTSVDGIAELIVHDESGLLVPPRDAETLAHALALLFTDEETRQRMGLAARQRIVAEFDGRAMAARTAEVYERLAQAKGVA